MKYLGVPMKLFKSKSEIKHVAMMKKMNPKYGTGRKLTNKELHPRLKRVYSKDDEFLGDNSSGKR